MESNYSVARPHVCLWLTVLDRAGKSAPNRSRAHVAADFVQTYLAPLTAAAPFM
jgi:hypothetical protein